MMRKMMILAAGGIGYVLGTRAGRERYDQIKGMASRVKENPAVQAKAHQAADVAKSQAPMMKDKLSGAADAARSKVAGGSGDVEGVPDDSLLNQDDPYPKGDLP